MVENINSIFKAYDIRGVYPDEINEENCYQIAVAFADIFKPQKVVIGYDARNSSQTIFNAVVSGLTDGGVSEVISLGLTGTEVMYFATGELQADAGLMITASHNPGKYNGIKFCGFGASPISLENGLDQVKNLLLTQEFTRKDLNPNLVNIDIYPLFIKKLRELVDFDKIKKFKVVVDAGNGVGGLVVSRVFEELGVVTIPLFFEPNGNFPNHEANPAKIENTSELRKEVLTQGADLGIALDGDGDRVFFIDDQGNYLSGYFLTSLLSIEMLKKYPDSPIVHESRVCWAIEDNVVKHGGKPIVSKCGHSNIKKVMRELDAPFGGENSSHFFYKDLYFADSSILTILLVLKILSDQNQKLSDVMKPYLEKYFISSEINFEVNKPQLVMEKIENYYQSQDLPVSKLDGLIIDNKRDWHVSVRISNTEPLVRLNVEAKNQEILDKVVKEVQELIVI